MNFINSVQERKISKFFPLIVIFFAGVGFRIYYFPHDLPLVVDSLSYFSYATETIFLGHLPTTWTTINNGWPMFLTFWFSIVNLRGVSPAFIPPSGQKLYTCTPQHFKLSLMSTISALNYCQ